MCSLAAGFPMARPGIAEAEQRAIMKLPPFGGQVMNGVVA